MNALPRLAVPVRLPRTPAETVERLAGERATGALSGPVGTVYLAEGLVVHAESEPAPDLAALLTGCGRIAPETWRETVRLFGPHGSVGDALIAQNLITRGELELCHLGALYDAAFFLLDSATAGPWHFEPGARHWLGPVTAVAAHRLCRETERRRRLLERVWPWPQLDTAPVRPARLPDGRDACADPGGRGLRRRPPTRRQCELLAHADGRRTPAELARLLGRSAFATTVDVRRLAAAGLLATPGCEATGRAPTGQTSTDGASTGREAPRHAAPRPGPSEARVPEARQYDARSPGTPPGTPPETVPGIPTAASVPPRTAGGLHRRVPGATLAGLPPAGPTRSARAPTTTTTTDAANPLIAPDPDIALLTRVRILLEARL
ncbi:hypothetical protein ACFVVX_24440 [Kitasatospora sp. NPDC058170]|uniref:hypothetical protein n=1 Tax=Kitasatospora sp. NPDC058170 TaxID=3346364 RepID=UPI0036D9AB0D